MRVYQFTEQAYYPAWKDHAGSLRINLPNSLSDPQIAADLFHRYYDESIFADELGLDIMLNEHHRPPPVSPLLRGRLAILARITKRAKLLALGVPLANRADPLRIAEELSMIDVISRGRLVMGFVKGVPFEVPVSPIPRSGPHDGPAVGVA